jgi:beta-lactamase regulating signal transducer with metallopeptidase domain
MTWLSAQTLAQISVERILNALPEGLLIAVFAWMLLRVLRRQNSGTRFAVWFLALLAVAALPVFGGFGLGRVEFAAGISPGAWGSMRPSIHIPAHWALFVFLVWALGSGVAIARLATGLWRLRRLRQSCVAIVAADLDPAVRSAVEAISATVTIATSESVRVPAAIGFWQRTIVLPTWTIRELPPHDLNAILLHEFAHLRRCDDWTNLTQKIVRALFFFHPAVWWIENRLSVEREMACDDAVLAQTANPHGYATCLVSLLEKSMAHRVANKRWSLVQAAVHRAREASLRLAQILDVNRPKATRVWRPALGMVAAFSLLCLLTLPHAPQFVAFDRGGPAATSEAEYAFANLPSVATEPSPAKVIPAKFQTSEPSPMAVKARTTAKVSRPIVRSHDTDENQFAPFRAITARMNAELSPGRFVVTSADDDNGDREIAPQFQTLVFVQATQFQLDDSSVWQVQVWRVTLVNAVGIRRVNVPVPHST